MKNKIIQGDCLEEMKQIPDGSIDAVICDPPYGTTACKWDTCIPFEPMWEQLKRVTKKNGAIVLFGNEPFSSTLRISNITDYKYDWIWVKDRGANFLNYNFQPSKNYELIHIFSSGATSYTKNGNNCPYFPQKTSGEPYEQKQGRGGDAVVRVGSRTGKNIITKNDGDRFPNAVQRFTSEKGFHPTQKPVALMEYLIKTYTNEGETVLDFTCGSGTTCLAAKNLKRNFIGIESDENYCKIAEERLNKLI